MSVFDRFRRNRQQSVLPDEVRQYYQTEKRQRRGVAIGLAILALLATIAVASALFFGGRWAYNQIRNDDEPTPANTADESGQNEENQENQGEAPAGSGGSPEPQNGSGQGNANPPTAPAPQPAPAPAPAPAPTTPSLGDQPALPHTGDPGM